MHYCLIFIKNSTSWLFFISHFIRHPQGIGGRSLPVDKPTALPYNGGPHTDCFRFPLMNELSRTPQNTKANNGKSESLLLNLLFNIIIPTVILTKLSGDDYLGTRLAIVVALAFPVIYGLKDFVAARKINFFSALGVVSVFLTGGISLLELDPAYIAIKEAAIPAVIDRKGQWSALREMSIQCFLDGSRILLPFITTELSAGHTADHGAAGYS